MHHRRRTKIVCTLGPAVGDREKLRALIEAGMNVARLNCSHGTWDQKAEWIKLIRELSPVDSPVAILADLQGPKFRIGAMPDDGLLLRRGDHLTAGRGGAVPIEQDEILRAMTVGNRLLMGDGEIELKIVGGEFPTFQAEVINGGVLRSRKGVTLVNRAFDVPALTDQDRYDVREAVKNGCDYIALSYVKSAEDIRELREVVAPLAPGMGICAKIETREAIRNIAEIIANVDLVMVARGDMGLQMDLEDVPLQQKEIIQLSNRRGVPVITATQMLESMIQNPRPTRAEATDVFNAILDGTDAVMLSGETATGDYPIECVGTMSRICVAAELIFDRSRLERDFKERTRTRIDHTDAIAHAVSDLARQLLPGAILCTSTSGQTPRLVSKYRPNTPILCSTGSPDAARRLAVVWGVETVVGENRLTTDEAVHDAVRKFRENGRLKVGDLVIITSGAPVGIPGNTNLVQVMLVSEQGLVPPNSTGYGH
ncbi:MAG: pyruvate kinase [Fimbriimonadaceae bacterium]|nr:pyruvate kinase [Fimbriimonadaceae bacterium]